MALESFYGGKPGYSPVIRGTFKYISENDSKYQNAIANKSELEIAQINKQVMNLCFQDPTYTDIWYGELCIINSDSMYDANNGKIFRRTLKKQSSSDDKSYNSLYAEYVGQIVGIPGGLPKVVFNTIDNIKDQAESNNTKDVWYPTGRDENTGLVTTGNQKGVLPAVFDEPNSIEFVPGAIKTNDEITDYNDTVQYTWLQMTDPQLDESESDGTVGTINIGLKIPYLFIDTPEVESVPYTNSPKAEELATDDNEDHPFYKKYKFEIPDGTPGISVRNLRLVTKQDLNNIPVYDPSNITFTWDSNDKIIKININNASYNLNNYSNNHHFWIYDLVMPEKGNNPSFTTYTCFAGDFDDINGVTLNQDGSFTFNTFYNNNRTTTDKIKWITSTNIVTDPNDENNYGNFTINYNNNPTNPSDVYTLPLVKKIIAYHSYETDNNNNEIVNEKIKVQLTNNNNSNREFILQKEVIVPPEIEGEDATTVLEDYILKYPTEVFISDGNPNIDPREDSESKYLRAIYNNGTQKRLGSVGSTRNNLSSIGIGYYEKEGNNLDIVKELDNEEHTYKINNRLLDATDGPLLLVRESINNFGDLNDIFLNFNNNNS